jgi:hypothetical protein
MNNIHSRIGLNNVINRKVKVYDVLKKELILEFESANQAGIALGVKNVIPYINSKSKCYKNNLGIVICFR